MASLPPNAATDTVHRTLRFLRGQLKADQFTLAASVRRRRNAEFEEHMARDRVQTLIARIQREVVRHPNLFKPSP